MLPTCPSLREIYAELMGLVDEFPEVEFDLRGHTLSVVTDPVTLDDMSLGPFRIELDLTAATG